VGAVVDDAGDEEEHRGDDTGQAKDEISAWLELLRLIVAKALRPTLNVIRDAAGQAARPRSTETYRDDLTRNGRLLAAALSDGTCPGRGTAR